MPAPRHRVRDAHTSCLYVCVYMCRERECVCVPAPRHRVHDTHTSCLCVCVCVCRENVCLCVCLRVIIGYAVLIRLACVCVYSMYKSSMCVCACASSSGTRCSYVLPVPRLVLPRLAYHVEHQDKRIRRGVGVRAGGSQGRRELQAAADNELVTERCAIRRT